MNFNLNVGQRALITTDAWFYGADGKRYNAAFGTIKAVRTAEDTLGVRPNGRSTNWYIEIGNLTIAGCQVHYALRCDDVHAGPAEESTWSAEAGIKLFERPCQIYFADADAPAPKALAE